MANEIVSRSFGGDVFYLLVEDQHDDPVEVKGFDHKDAALRWVTQFEVNSAMESGVATDGEKIVCHVFDVAEYANAARSKEESGTGWLDCSHRVFTVTGDYCPNYYAEEVKDREPS